MGVWSILKSPVNSRTPTGVVMATATQSGMLCVTRMNSSVKRADGDGFARLDALQAVAGVDAVLVELRLDEASVIAVP